MLILTLRTDKPESELGVFEDDRQVAYESWQAHRQLAETLHTKLKELLVRQSKSWEDIDGVVVYKGPGSFTGLRIGISVANALADSLCVPIVGTTGEAWLQSGRDLLRQGANDQRVLPEYGSEAHITPPRK